MTIINDGEKVYRVDCVPTGAIIRVDRKIISVNEPVAFFISEYYTCGLSTAVENVKQKYFCVNGYFDQVAFEEFISLMIAKFEKNDLFIDLVKTYHQDNIP